MTAHDVILGPLWAVIDRPYRERLVPIFLLQATTVHHPILMALIIYHNVFGCLHMVEYACP